MKDARDIIKRPVVTENTTELMESNVYTFEVDGHANKIEIAQAVETLFKGSKVAAVNTLWVPAKRKRYGKHYGFTSKWKKAYVKFTAESELPDFLG
ncbi:50S ribosomal protein L23 [Ferroacidibacillus organovorans]|uniref:Large ribosomal subunit protein uL23 n=1 Tax=Ferroacidibacillus organovorans TaxID=1765683 RepID=A0A101XPF1_9BACL|nr:50S ribosomal protein L23 [Ferroacidibacillus organovorans]KUO95177.1 50S ribosomal protein L23 [Ferroacidibacillus organovorans]